jgi:hypothetical protein
MSGSKQRINTSFLFMLLVISGMLIFSVYYLYDALMNIEGDDPTNSSFNILLGMIGLSVTVYLATQLLRRPRTKKAPPKLLTTLECSNCELKTIRGFAKGDYVFKTGEACPKCEGHMLVTAIYAEDEKK